MSIPTTPFTDTIVGMPNTDILLIRALRTGLSEIRQYPVLLEYIFKEYCDINLEANYGNKQINAIKNWFLTNKIDVTFGFFNQDKPSLPVISVKLLSSVEDKGFSSLGDLDPEAIPEFLDGQKYYQQPRTFLGPFNASYSSSSGILTLPSGFDADGVFAGQFIICPSSGNKYQIQSILSDSTIQLSVGLSDNFIGSYVAPAYDNVKVKYNHVTFKQNYEVGCYTTTDAAQIVWLSAITQYILLKYRQSLIEAKNLNISTISAGPFEEYLYGTDAIQVLKQGINIEFWSDARVVSDFAPIIEGVEPINLNLMGSINTGLFSTLTGSSGINIVATSDGEGGLTFTLAEKTKLDGLPVDATSKEYVDAQDQSILSQAEAYTNAHLIPAFTGSARKYLQENPANTAAWDRLTLDVYSKVNMPSSSVTGRMVLISDDSKGVVIDNGTNQIFLNGEYLNAKEYNIISDRLDLTDVSINAGSAVVFSPSVDFTNYVGKQISVEQAGQIQTSITNAAINVSTSILSSASLDFTNYVGMRVIIQGAGSEAIGGGLTGKHFTINSLGSDIHHAILSTTADITVSSATATIGLGAGLTGTINSLGSDIHHVNVSFSASQTLTNVRATIGSGTSNWNNYNTLVSIATSLNKPIFWPSGKYWLLPPSSGTTTINISASSSLIEYGYDKATVDILAAVPFVDSMQRVGHTGYSFIVHTIGDNCFTDFKNITWRGPYNNMPDDFTNGPISTFWYSQDASSKTECNFSNCDFLGRFTLVLEKAGGSTTGKYYMRVSNAFMESCGQNISVFTAEGAETWLECTDVIFSKSGLVPDSTWQNGGHSLYLHPPVNQRMTRCTWLNTGFYAVHMFSGSGIGANTVPKMIAYDKCYFGPGVTNGILCSDAKLAVNSFNQCSFQGAYGIYVNGHTLINGCQFYSSTGQHSLLPAFDTNINVEVCNTEFIGGGCSIGLSTNASRVVWRFKNCTADLSDTVIQSLFTTTADCEVHIDGFELIGGSGTIHQASSLYLGHGTFYINNLRCSGQWGFFAASAPIEIVTGGSLVSVNIDDSVFNVTNGDAIHVNSSVTNNIIFGNNNIFTGTGKLNCVSGTKQSFTTKSRKYPTSLSISSNAISPSSSYNTFKVTAASATVLSTILLDGLQSVQDGHDGTRCILIADGNWSMSNAGNISPKNNLTRIANETITLIWDTSQSLWIEV